MKKISNLWKRLSKTADQQTGTVETQDNTNDSKAHIHNLIIVDESADRWSGKLVKRMGRI